MVQSLDDARHRGRSAARGRVPPHNLEAEESLLGAMILSKDAIATAVERCAAGDFYKPAHGHIFDAVTALYAQGEPADTVTIADELRRAGLLDAIGGPATLITLQTNTPAISNAARYARIVEEHALLRRMIGVAAEIAELGYEVPEDVTAAVDRAETMIFEVAQRRGVDTVATIRDLLARTLDNLESLYDRADTITGVPTGYNDLDERLAGLQPSNLVIVGGRPSMGKTSFALGMVAHAAMERRLPVLLFSLEMSHLELSQRLLCAEARVDATRMRNGRLLESDWPKISAAIGHLGEAPIFIDDNPNITVMDIRAKARRLKSREGLGLVVVDYLQLMSGRTTAENRQVEVSEISRGLKILARELEVPVVALSQLSRNLEMRADKRPVLADLRESGCMPASTRLLRADNGEEVTLGELVLSQEQPLVWSLNEDWEMEPRRLIKAFPSGVKPVFRLRLASGYEVEATANHQFRTVPGWTRLDQLTPGDHLAVPRRIRKPAQLGEWPDDELILLAHLLGDGSIGPNGVRYATADPANKMVVEQAADRLFGISVKGRQKGRTWLLWFPAPYRLTHGRRHPIRNWLEPVGLWGSRAHDKFIPEEILGLADEKVALFLRHLWATDGSVTIRRHGCGPLVQVYYSSSSRRLADGVRRALLRLDIRTRLGRVRKAGSRDRWQVRIDGAREISKFLTLVGCHGARGDRIAECLGILAAAKPKTSVDLVPRAVAEQVKASMESKGVSSHTLATAVGERHCSSYPLGTARRPRRFSRTRLGQMAAALADQKLAALASSEVIWDEVVEIVPLGPMPTFDATVEGTHNFVANGVIAHNSLEQDADVVLFIYRDEVYHPDSPDRGTAEIILSKHRNGPTGLTQLAFLEHYTRFANMARV